MKTIYLILSVSAIALASATAQAAQHGQEEPGGMMQQHGGPTTGLMGQSGMNSQGGMGHGMVLKMMMAMMDTDGDSVLSLEEFQALHARMFGLIDADGDGALTLEEIQSFMQDGKMPAGGAH
ncbi:MULTISPECIES: EF-hand domain-containing protein [Hyphomicrobiales]|jgi:hypothetical protein|uniref:EF-hand domain-containing protein n=1 Tax=Rhodopseudomonas palustris TaxID=1076 RepID=A0A0D7ER57_RHOPL|nr:MULTISPECIES: EF-hand domain-containing protein [Hyphomicrobiales]KIZ41937.1 hypothetical protein OO17_13865 [Rhodopseudomonas palustris]MCD1637050.1 EF-hand domain-containing protein [Martelella mediterranea]MDF3809886.1 EF-hand domain-containing protein [Rhodopseudomonas sp. BAL398]WOK17940.1 EF-hand domain-containing protein [Rhodopseudomonas sp. BAL398]